MTTITPRALPSALTPDGSPLTAFLGDDGQTIVELDAGLAAFVPVGRWAVFPSDPLVPAARRGEAVADLLAQMRARRLRPVVVATEHPDAWRQQGMFVSPVANDARIDLTTFTLSGKRISKVRHAMASADRAGLRIGRFRPALAEQLQQLSNEWLATKRGGELRLTLGVFDPDRIDPDLCRVAVDPGGIVMGFVTWRSYDAGRGRVLDLMRRRPDAPNPTMDALIGHSLEEFRQVGLAEASLNAVPLSPGALGERVYPTVSLRNFKEKFNPRWVEQSMVTPSRRHHVRALMAVGRAYCPEGLLRALRANGEARP